MSIQVAIPTLFAIIGALMYLFSSNSKVGEIGRIAFACGLFIALLAVANHTLRF